MPSDETQLMTADEIAAMLRWRPRDPMLAVRFLRCVAGLSPEALAACACIPADRLANFETGRVYLSQQELLAVVTAIRHQLRKGNQVLRRQAAIRARRRGRPRKRSPVTAPIPPVVLASSTAEQLVASEIRM